MKNYGVFDILGPTMIGPSSSHTAGAVRLGKIGRDIVGPQFNKVVFNLHGSFAQTYKGHGTDKALVAGILGMKPNDERIKNSLELAKVQGIEISFNEKDLGYVHPNTVEIIFYSNTSDIQEYYIIGSSIGGASIEIININGLPVQFTGDYPTILIQYNDVKGAISRISSIISAKDVNIATLKVTREGKIASMIMEIDSPVTDEILDKIKNLDEVIYASGINAIER